MSELKPSNSNKHNFSWKSIGDIEEGRKNLGTDMPVFAYRLFELSLRNELTKLYGYEKTAEIFRNAGKSSGLELASNVLDLSLPVNEFLSHLSDILEENRMGILRIEEFDKLSGDIKLTISEDLDCSGLPVTGEVVCSYDEGLLAGILEAYTKKEYSVEEIDCWAAGARVCRFVGRIKIRN